MLKHVFFCVCLFSASTSAAQRLAITIDDLPYVMPSRVSAEVGMAQVDAVIWALAKHEINAVGFVVGSQLNSKSRAAVEAFARAGHVICNHSWSHPDLGNITLGAFESETRRTHRAIAPWLGEARLYRFPYLREGETVEKRDGAKSVLSNLGYRNVPVTIDNDDWRFNAAYMDGETGAAEAYLIHMKERTTHFQALARERLGRDIPHILLLHMNAINADHLVRLLDWYAQEGWEFVSVGEALQDEIFLIEDRYSGKKGLSWIERVSFAPSTGSVQITK